MTFTKLILSMIVAAGCGAQDFEFSASIVTAPEAEVRIDDTPVVVIDMKATFEMSYPSYDEARADRERVIAVYLNGVLAREGIFKPGVCAVQCSAGGCPSLESIKREEVSLPFERDFMVGDFDCANCISDDTYTTICSN